MTLSLIAFGIIALVLPFLARRLGNRVFWLAAIVPAAVFAGTLFATPTILAGGTLDETFDWIPQLNLTLSFRMDALAYVMALIVTGVGALVIVYCARYFRRDEEGLGRFASVLVAFAGAMYGLVTADDIYLLFMFWEATSVFSYLLIGHYNAKRASRTAALQALLVTTAGGLAMLVGVVLIAVESNTARISEIIANPPAPSGLVITAVILMLAGALSKSALVPLHFWLPAAMAAPTPVSAYLHAAAMVKAGIFLIALLAPAFADVPGWRPLLVGLGVLTMLVGGWRALRQFDLKLVLAYGTVSQLGFLTVIVGYGTRDAALAGLALVTGHALFKSTLFLVVGIIDNRVGTRDLRKISGLGKQAPVLATIAILAAASMAGLPPTLGFVAKEGTFTALLDDAANGGFLGLIALIGVSLGSILTAAYTARFLWGAFAAKPKVKPVRYVAEHFDFLISPAILAVAGLVLGLFAGALDPLYSLYADTVPGRSAESIAAGAGPLEHPAHLALWHGFEPALGISALTLAIGLVLFWQRARVTAFQKKIPPILDSARGYLATVRAVDAIAVKTTSVTQRGSLPTYVAIILLVFVAAVGAALATVTDWPTEIRLWDSTAQVPIAVIMAIATIAAARAGKRFMAVVLVGVTGYGMVAIFAIQGAADLALTQALVETVTLVVFVLVLRRLPARIGLDHARPRRILRAIIGAAVGITMGIVAVVAAGSRVADPISLMFPDLAYEGGHGKNVVNVTLVDIRGWDTLGEISVLVVAATGVASLIFLSRRTAQLPRLDESTVRPRFFRRGTVTEPELMIDDSDQATLKITRRPWLLAGKTLAPQNRSIILEVVVRLLFHSAIVVSVYLLFAGHNVPGGGFAGGLVAGLALVARYLAAGRYELGEAAPIDAGKLLGTGLVLAAGTAAVPLFFGQNALTSTFWEIDVAVLGQLEFVTSTIFDIGVYLVVVGLTLDVLRSLGAEVDRQHEEDHNDDVDNGDAGQIAASVSDNDKDEHSTDGLLGRSTL